MNFLPTHCCGDKAEAESVPALRSVVTGLALGVNEWEYMTVEIIASAARAQTT
jgi:hypothetical protein